MKPEIKDVILLLWEVVEDKNKTADIWDSYKDTYLASYYRHQASGIISAIKEIEDVWR
ncbi:MAG: hypothetical protein OXF77_00910 [Thaumarchaeota archaeon]|nr:hypothetical protein [Nitrososphaerota archaeon]